MTGLVGLAVVGIGSSLNPTFIQLESVGSVTLTSAMQDCVSLTRINIPIQVTMGSRMSYFMEFTDPITSRGVYIGEVRNVSLMLMVIVAVPISHARQKNIYNSTSRRATLFRNLNPILVVVMAPPIV